MRSRAGRALGLFVLWSSACAGPAPAPLPPETPKSQPKSAESEPSPLPDATPKPDRSDPLSSGQLVDFSEELRLVERLRGLTAQKKIVGRTISRQALSAHLEQNVDRDLPREAQKGLEHSLVLLGLAPPTFDYRATLVQLLAGDLAGFYDPREGALFLKEHLEGEERLITLHHELVHALQDQTFDLAWMSEYEVDRSDRLGAFSSLAEGDATSLMFDAMLAESGRSTLDLPIALIEAQLRAASAGQAPLEAAPPVLRRSLLSPYLDGLRFVLELRRRGGYREVNAAFRRPPETTEQLLHPEKYYAGEPGRPVPVPSAPEGYPIGPLFHDVWGEQSVRLVLEEWLPLVIAAESAAGWGGDRMAIYEKGDEAALAWSIVMDETAHAKRLAAAWLRRGTREGLARPKAIQADELACLSLPGHLSQGLLRRGKQVVIASRRRAIEGAAAPARSQVQDDCAWLLGWADQVEKQGG